MMGRRVKTTNLSIVNAVKKGELYLHISKPIVYKQRDYIDAIPTIPEMTNVRSVHVMSRLIGGQVRGYWLMPDGELRLWVLNTPTNWTEIDDWVKMELQMNNQYIECGLK